MELPKSRYGLYQHDKVLKDGKPVGVSLDVGYINNEHAFVSLATPAGAHLDTPRAALLRCGTARLLDEIAA